MTAEKLIQDILFFSKLSFDRRLVSAMGGNISAVLDGKMYITATNTCLGYLEPSDIVVCDMDGVCLGGDKKPSKEVGMHALVYKLRPDARCVAHLHPTYMVALSVAGKSLPTDKTGPSRNKLFDVPFIPFAQTNAPELLDGITSAMRGMREGSSLFMIAEHGTVAFGPTLHDAFCSTDLAEDTAKTICISNGLL